MNKIPKGRDRPKVPPLAQQGYEHKGGSNRATSQVAVRPPPPAPINPRPAFPLEAVLAKGGGTAAGDKK